MELVEATDVCISKEDSRIELVEKMILYFCPEDRICSGAPEAFKDFLNKDCCPDDKPVCTGGHCCPTDKPKWLSLIHI